MRITKNAKDTVCNLCQQPLRKGSFGANYSATLSTIRRGHPDCVKDWLAKQVKQYVNR